MQGREQTYVLPAMAMRVASLVPETARHIRESGVPTFGEIAAREFRARMFRLIALILFGVAALMLAVAVVRWLVGAERANPTRRTASAAPSRRARGVRGELRAIQRRHARRMDAGDRGTRAAAARDRGELPRGPAGRAARSTDRRAAASLLRRGGWLLAPPRRRLGADNRAWRVERGSCGAAGI